MKRNRILSIVSTLGLMGSLATTAWANGKEAELEMEAGVLLWSFDLPMPGATLATEAGVNAVTGKAVNRELEAPEFEHEKAEAGERHKSRPHESETRERGAKHRHETETRERGGRGEK